MIETNKNTEDREMLMTITASKLTLIEIAAHRYVAEASDLGFPVGQIPYMLHTPEIGNKRPFVLTHVTEQTFEYLQAEGCARLTVFND